MQVYDRLSSWMPSQRLTYRHPKRSCHEPVLVTLMTLPIHNASNAQPTSTVAFFSMNWRNGHHRYKHQHPERTQH